MDRELISRELISITRMLIGSDYALVQAERTMGGWSITFRGSNGDVVVSKVKPITRGANTQFHIDGPNGNKRISAGTAGSPDNKIHSYLMKTYGIDWNASQKARMEILKKESL